MTMITPSYLGETIEYSSLHACRSTLEDPTLISDQSSSRDTMAILPHKLIQRRHVRSIPTPLKTMDS